MKPQFQAFLPQTQDEYWLRLDERLQQAWPTFGIEGTSQDLSIKNFAVGAMIRFYAADGLTWHPGGAFRMGAVWCLHAKRAGRYMYQTPDQMQSFLVANELNWVEIK